MKIKLLLLLFVISTYTVVAQEVDYQKSIDSLQDIKNQYSKKIQQIDSEIDILHKKVTLQTLQNPHNLNISTILDKEARVRENTWGLGLLKVLPAGSEVTLLDFTDNYWKVNYGQGVGYYSGPQKLDRKNG